MKIVLIDEDEELAFQVYAKQIGIPLGKWYEDMWVNAFCTIKGITPREALAELKRRSDNYHSSCCCHS
ncbi:MAG: hypothetical protein KBT06_11250 [Prevotellaceae bacterium]|nr:hypothetical protein [Candidatus Colivivens equi]MCQ2076255.1 hypothetical protein [Bacteroidaceae bacterium]